MMEAATMKERPVRLFLDQYRTLWQARTVRELREKIGGGRVSIMYRDKTDGRTVRCGYVIGQLWLSEVAPVEKEAKP